MLGKNKRVKMMTMKPKTQTQNEHLPVQSQ